MSIVDKIQNQLASQKRNIVFFFDADNSLSEEFPAIEAAGLKVVEVNNNFFELKYRLEKEWSGEKIFLYHAYPRPNDKEIKKYPLLDLLKANCELRLDDTSEFLTEYHLSDSYASLVKQYIKLLKTKTNQKKLSRILNNTNFNESNLKRGLISVVLDFNTVMDRNSCIAKFLYLAIDEELFSKAIKTLSELDLDTELLTWINELMGASCKHLSTEMAVEIASKIKYNIITQYVAKTVKNDSYAKLKIDRIADLNKVIAFFQDCQNTKQLTELINPVFEVLGKDIVSQQIINWYGLETEYGYYSEDMLTYLISDLYKNVTVTPSKTKDEAFKWQRSEIVKYELKNQVNFIYHVAGLYNVLDTYKSFVFNKLEDFITEYKETLFKVDFHYRKSIIEFDAVRNSLFEFEDLAMDVFKNLNLRYDRFLIDLNNEWQKLLNEKKFRYQDIDIKKQYNFFNDNLKDFDYKIVVIISDALRYELGYELYNELLANSKNSVTIEPCLASIPSYTDLGMSNLLPNNGIQAEFEKDNLLYKINGKHTVSSNRTSILQQAQKDSICVDFTALKRMTKEEKRAFIKDYRVTYVYHDWVDAIGDKKRTEHEMFGVTYKAVDELTWMINNISGEMGVMHILVTSDHGFLYNYNDLKESSRESMPKIKGKGVEHTRFAIAEEFEGKIDGYTFNLSDTTNIESNLKVAVPRAINRFRKGGNIGVQFSHGGPSLQELITPVIKYYKHKKETNQMVSFKRIDQNDKLASGSIKITLLQDQPISNDYKSIEVLFALYSDVGELFSNEVEIHFNSTSTNPKERIFDVILSLNTQGSKASFCYLKAFDKKDNNKLNPLGLNDLIKINTLMEKDEF